MMTLLNKDFGFKRTTAKPDYFITAYERAPTFILKVLSSKKLSVYEQKKALSEIAFIIIFITTMNYISAISDLKNGRSATWIVNTNLIFRCFFNISLQPSTENGSSLALQSSLLKKYFQPENG